MAEIRVVALVRDLMTASRIESRVAGAGGTLTQVAGPDQLPPAGGVDLLVVDWSDRDPTWASVIRRWREAGADSHHPRIVLFGPHTDLVAHAAAKEAGLGPMKARSAFFSTLPALLRDELTV